MLVGRATDIGNMQNTLLSTAFFFACSKCIDMLSRSCYGKYDQFSSKEKVRWNYLFLSLFHSVPVCIVAMKLVVVQEESLLSDRIYGYSPTAERLFSYSAGYFLLDVLLCLSDPKVDFAFLFHAVRMFLAGFFFLIRNGN